MKGPLPLKPVDVHDSFGFRCALYAVNALYKRCGISPVTSTCARKTISNLIKQSNAEQLTLLLQEWCSTKIDKAKVQELISEIPEKLLREDPTRYQEEELAVNDIEWSALATAYRCCVAVKFLISEHMSQNDAVNKKQHKVSWKIAVPSPKLFNVSEENSSGPATACVFLVCQQAGSFKKFFPLIPSQQPIFKPGIPMRIAKPISDIPASSQDRTTSSQSRCQKEVEETTKLPGTPPSDLILREETMLQSPEVSSSLISSQKELKQVKFSARKETIGYATPVTAPSTPKKEPISSLPEEELPSEPMQMALGNILSAVGHPEIQKENAGKYDSSSQFQSQKRSISDTKRAREISELSDASVLYHRIYGTDSKKEREASSLDIYGRVYDAYRM